MSLYSARWGVGGTMNVFMLQVDVVQYRVGLIACLCRNVTALTPCVNVTDIDTNPLLLLTAARPHVSSLL